jgi:hypothetical protein
MPTRYREEGFRVGAVAGVPTECGSEALAENGFALLAIFEVSDTPCWEVSALIAPMMKGDYGQDGRYPQVF